MNRLLRNDTVFAQRRGKELLFVLVLALVLTAPWVPLSCFCLYAGLVGLEEYYNGEIVDTERTTLLSGLGMW